jgi:hypothetical protein
MSSCTQGIYAVGHSSVCVPILPFWVAAMRANAALGSLGFDPDDRLRQSAQRGHLTRRILNLRRRQKIDVLKKSLEILGFHLGHQLRKASAYAPFSCLIPRFDGAILSQAWKEAIWGTFVTRAPRPRTPSEQQYSDRKLRSRG